MQKYIKNYIDSMGYSVGDFVICEACEKKEAADVHHIGGRGKGMDEAWNLIALCRECHQKAHGILNKGEKKLEKQLLYEIAQNNGRGKDSQ